MFSSNSSGSVSEVIDASADTRLSEYNVFQLMNIGNNGGQNHTFLDSSSNNHTVTKTGNVIQGSVGPFSPTWFSTYFNGTADYIAVANNPNEFGTGDLTVEMTIKPRSFAADTCIYDTCTGGDTSGTGRFLLMLKTTGLVYVYTGSGNVLLAVSSTAISINKWTHIAITRQGTAFKLFLDGKLAGSGTNSINFTTVVGRPLIGANGYDGTLKFTGLISNLRTIKGTALYTNDFTPPTGPLTVIGDTTLLMFTDKSFKDKSSYNCDLTVTGAPAVVPMGSFPRTVPYDPATHNGSGLWRAVGGDKLSLPANHASFSFGTGDFCIEATVYPNIINSVQPIFTTDGSNLGGIDVGFNASGTPMLYHNVAAYRYGATGSVKPGRWTHLAFVRIAGMLTIYVNGIPNTPAAFTNTNTTANIWIGCNPSATTEVFNGYISNLRVVKGNGVYTEAFTPHTGPLANIAGTSLLMHFNNASTIDATCNVNIENINNSQCNTSVEKYTNTSLYCDGVNDQLKISPNPNWIFPGDHTIGAWIYPNAVGVDMHIFGGGGAGTNDQLIVRPSNTGTGQITYLYGAAGNLALITNAYIPLHKWTHIAISRISGILKVFINGVQVHTRTLATSVGQNALNYIGARTDAANDLNGYIVDLEVLNGVGKYNGNFIPATRKSSPINDIDDPYFHTNIFSLETKAVNDENNNTIIDASTGAVTMVKNGNVAQGSFSPFSPRGYSGAFIPGSYLTTPSVAGNALGTGNFTIEAFVNLAGYNGNMAIIEWVAGATDGLSLYVNSASSLVASTYTLGYGGGGCVPIGEWCHVACTAQSGTIRVFVAGKQVYTGAQSYNCIATQINIGGTNFKGLISNARCIKGVSLYNADFIPPTSNLTAVAGTILLTCQDNKFKDNSSVNHVLTPTGTPSVVSFNPFSTTVVYSPSLHGGSAYFDGTGDYTETPDLAKFAIAGDFTYSANIYPIARVGNQTILATPHNTLYITSGGVLTFVWQSVATHTSTGIVPLYQWSHVAVSRIGTTLKIFLNGAQVFTGTSATVLTGTRVLRIGADVSGTHPFKGYISDAKVDNVGLYTGNFTPPTVPAVGNANTQLLLNFTNANVYDLTGVSNIETVGTAKISTTRLLPNGNPSLEFDGSVGCYAKLTPGHQWNFNQINFSIEFDYYKTAHPGNDARLFQTNDGTGYTGINIVDNAGTLKVTMGSNGSTWDILNISTAAMALNVWNNICVRREGGTIVVYLNGVQVGTGASLLNVYFNSYVQVPVIGGDTGGRTLIGNIGNFRINRQDPKVSTDPIELTM